MSLSDSIKKLPLINSSNKIVKIAGYIIYAFVFLIILGIILPSPDETGIEQQDASATSTDDVSKSASMASVPLGSSAIVDDWEITISRFRPSASRTIKQENQFNAEPSAGGQYAMVYVNAKNLGNEKRSFSTGNLHLEGSSGQDYDQPFALVIPDAFSAEAFPGATAKGNIVFDVATQDINSVKLYYSGAWSSDKTYFDLR